MSTKADKVAAHISSLRDWQYVASGLPYGHMGETLTDAVLQSGISYDTRLRVPRRMEARVLWADTEDR